MFTDCSESKLLINIMSLSRAKVSVQILLLTLITFAVSDVQKLTITPVKGITININSSTQVKNCKVCTGTKPFRRCDTAQQFKDTSSVSVVLECPKPHNIFRMFVIQIVQNIECTTQSCNGHINQTESSFPSFLDFNRTFTWNLKASSQRAFKIDFNKTGLRQIHPSEICPDRHSYTLQALQTTGNVTIGKYCRVGIISSAQILNYGSFSVEVPAGQKLQNGQFDVSVGEEIKSLAKITLMFSKEISSSELLSPNYPDSFPNDDMMEWYFQVPDKHKISIEMLNLTEPQCLKKNTAVEYHSKGRAALVLSLTDPQPDHNWGNFSLTLRNCEMNRKITGSSGLSVNLKVSTSPKSPAKLPIILSVLTAVLAIFVIVLLVACVVIKKKKKKNQNHQVSIYKPNIPPGCSDFPKATEDEYHVYATIDETQIYLNLLKDDAEVNFSTEFDTN